MNRRRAERAETFSRAWGMILAAYCLGMWVGVAIALLAVR